MPAIPRLLLIRHGETAWNAEKRWQGWADVPLSPVGEEQAKQAAVALGTFFSVDAPLHLIASSDLTRAQQTAEILRVHLAAHDPIHTERGLRERDVGELSGLTAAQVEEHWPGLLARWRAGGIEAPPGGESTADFLARTREAVESLLAGTPPGSTTLAVTHGGVIRVLEHHLGVESLGTRNLGGRFFHVEETTLAAGEILMLESV